MIIPRKIEYDYYFRIDYTIINGVCQPLHLFNTTETIHSIENIVLLIYSIDFSLEFLFFFLRQIRELIKY